MTTKIQDLQEEPESTIGGKPFHPEHTPAAEAEEARRRAVNHELDRRAIEEHAPHTAGETGRAEPPSSEPG